MKTLDIRGESITIAYTEIFEGFPPELRFPIVRLVDTLREELGTGRADIDQLKDIMRDLAQAQGQTEACIEELVQPQQRTELRMERLGVEICSDITTLR